MRISLISKRYLFSDLGMYDRVIVQDVIKNIAQSQQIDQNAKHQFKGKITKHKKKKGET